jgi:tetratricopeptide (TPR) repeat protein
MLFEDVHWADPSTLELIDLALARLHDWQVLIVMTFRPEFQARWTGQAGVTLIALSRLEPDESAQLAAQITMDQVLPPALLARIVSQADGVPLFIEELTNAVLESGAPTAAALGVPETLQASLMARLDRLPLSKQVAQIGSIIGREFSHELIRSLAGMQDSALADGLEQLVASGLVFRRGEPPYATYLFKHALVQDAVYGTLLLTRRKVLHGQLAQVFEAHFHDIVERGPEVLAHHLTEAGQPAKAAPYWLEAGRLAARRSAYIEAVNHLRRGIEVSSGIEDAQERDRLELGLQLALGPALMATQGFASLRSADAYRRAQEVAERLGDLRSSFVANLGLWFFSSNSEGAGTTTQQLVDLLFRIAEHVNDRELRLQAHHAAWQTALTSGSGDLIAVRSHVSRGLSLYDRDKHRGHALIYGGHDPAVCGYGTGAVALWLLGYPDQARQSVSEGLSLAKTLSHVPSLAHALWFYAMTHQLRGEFQTVLHCSERLVSVSAEYGLPYYKAIGDIMYGAALAGLGEVEKGLRGLRQGMESYLALKGRGSIGFYYMLFAEAELRAEQPQLGLTALDKAAQQFGVHGSTWDSGLVCVRGDLLMAANDPVGAEGCYKKSLEIARHQQAKSFELRAAMHLTRLRRRADGEDILGPVYSWFTEGFDTGDLKEARTILQLA